jgi:hypothetical protein
VSADGPPPRSASELLLSIALHQMDARDDEDLDALIQAMLCRAYPTPLAQNQ